VNPLLLLVVIPLLTMAIVVMTRDIRNVRVVSAVGMSLQLIFSLLLLYMFYQERNSGNTDPMLFVSTTTWYESFNIQLKFGVDGISVSMILLTSIVTFAGIFVSWEVDFLTKEFFISLILLASGVFGFFISLDLFTMFLFYEIAVIPMYLLIGIWGSGPKEYAAMKLTLMLMGGSALLLVGLLGIYFNSAPAGGKLTFDLTEIAKNGVPYAAQMFTHPHQPLYPCCMPAC
jgi:NADH-quinone oxidoreductase subunit M